MILVPPNVQSRIQAARNATKHKKTILSSSIQPVANEKDELDESTENFFSYLDSKPTEEHLSTVRVGPSASQINNQSTIYAFEEDVSSSDATTTTTTTTQVIEGIQGNQQQVPSNVQERLSGGSDVNSSSHLDPEAVSTCML